MRTDLRAVGEVLIKGREKKNAAIPIFGAREAIEKDRALLSKQNIAVTLFMPDYYRHNKQILPTDVLFREKLPGYRTRDDPKINAVKNEIILINSALAATMKKIEKMQGSSL